VSSFTNCALLADDEVAPDEPDPEEPDPDEPEPDDPEPEDPEPDDPEPDEPEPDDDERVEVWPQPPASNATARKAAMNAIFGRKVI
jgi:hypothetical protein